MPVIKILNSRYQQEEIDLQRTLADTEEGPLFFRGWTEIGQHKQEDSSKIFKEAVHPCKEACTICHDQSARNGDLFFNASVEGFQQGSKNGCSLLLRLSTKTRNST